MLVRTLSYTSCARDVYAACPAGRRPCRPRSAPGPLRTGIGAPTAGSSTPCHASPPFIWSPLEGERSEPQHVTTLALPNAVSPHRSLVCKPCSAGNRDRLLVSGDDRQKDASRPQVEQPPSEQDRRASRIAASSGARCDPVAELRYVLFAPVVHPAAADRGAGPRVHDREHDPTRCSGRSKRAPVRRELVDDGLSVPDREGWSRASSPIVTTVVAPDRRVGASFRHETGRRLSTKVARRPDRRRASRLDCRQTHGQLVTA